MKNKQKRDQVRIYQEGLRKLLNDWDFIGIMPEASADEYDDLHGIIMHWLTSNDHKSILVHKLTTAIHTNYGISVPTTDVESFVDNVTKWWAGVRQDLG